MAETKSSSESTLKPKGRRRRLLLIVLAMTLFTAGFAAWSYMENASRTEAKLALLIRGYEIYSGDVGPSWYVDIARHLSLPIRDGVIGVANRDADAHDLEFYGWFTGRYDRNTPTPPALKLTPQDWQALKQYRYTKQLSLVDAGVTDEHLRIIGKFSDLEYLNLSGNSITDEGLKHLASLSQLRGLNLDRNHITDTGLAHLSGLTKLNHLSLAQNNLTGQGFEHFVGFNSLASLDAANNQIRDEHLIHLAALNNLFGLNLAHNQITGAGLPPFRIMNHLNLSHNQVTDDVIATLHDDIRIRALNLAANPVTAAMLPHLSKMIFLEKLDLTQTPITRSEVRKALPNLLMMNRVLLFSNNPK